MRQPAPSTTSHKAVYTSLATSAMTIVLMMSGVIPIDEALFASESERVFTILAAIVAQAAAAGLATYFKRNFLK